MWTNAHRVAMFFVLSYAFAWTGFALMYFTGASSSQPLFYAALPLVTFAPLARL
jgi:hypothetical protein